MTYYIVGTGNTAWFMAKRLMKAGHSCLGIYGRNEDKAKQLAAAINAPVLAELQDIQDDADACILAITDNAIEEVAAHFSLQNTTLIHTAGSVGRMVLEPYAQHAGIIWPVYSIVKDSLPLHREIPIVIKGTTEHSEDVLKRLVNAMSDICYTISWEQRQWLHLCAVLSNNFVNHLMSISEEICNKQRIPFSLLYPIVNQTTDRIKQASPKNLQTGPAKRHDVNTLQKHMELLSANPEWARLYESVTSSIDKMYRKDKEE